MAYTTINKSSDYFNTKLYTGNGGTQSITGVGHQPDLVWIKSRGTNGENHYLFDAIRGTTKYIHSDTSAAQSTNSSTLTAFGSNGFSVGANNSVNKSSDPLVSWNWKANGQGSSNTAGTINSTYTSANTTSGFSIVQYTGNASQSQTVGHGLGVAPKLIIFKSLTSTDDWSICCPSVLGVDGRLTLNTTAANSVGDNTFWNSAAPSSTLFSLGNNSRANASGKTIIAYCFAEVKGFSKIGQYVGNGNANGTFVYTGFKPSFFMIKEVPTTSDWHISFNNVATQQNPIKGLLYPNSAGTDSNTASVDFNSNGVKIRTSGGGQNENNKAYLYMALAEAPLVGTNNIPATAR